MERDAEYIRLIERTFSAEDRRRLAKSGAAKPDGSYPIESCEDAAHAVADCGRGGATASDKAHIKSRIKTLGCKMPSTWQEAVDGYPEMFNSNEHFDRWMESEDVIASGQNEQGEEERLVVTSTSSVCQLLEVDKTGREVQFMLIEKGTSKNGYRYSDSVLRQAVPLFNGVYAFADHTNEAEQRVRPERSVNDKVGRWANVSYGTANIGGRVTEGVIGTLKVIHPDWRQRFKESVEMGEPDFYGVSIDALGKSAPKSDGGRRVKEVQQIHKVFSVDIVTTPSAGGRLMRLVASDQEGRRTLETEESTAGVQMTPEQLSQTIREAVAEVMRSQVVPLQQALQEQRETTTRLNEAQRFMEQEARIDVALRSATGLSEIGRTRLKESLIETARRRNLEDAELIESVRGQVQYEAQLLEHLSPGHGPRSSARIQVGQVEADKHYQALIGLFENQDQIVNGVAIPRYRSIKEAYCRWTNRDSFEVDPMEIQRAFSVTYDSAYDHQKIQESVSTASWGQVYADVLYLMLIKSYRVNPVYNKWRAVVSDVENVPDFQTRHWTRLGGYSDLSTVPESATYQPMVSSTNEQVTYSVSKRGGLDDVTFEAIANDRVGAIRRIPIAMARSAARTLYKFVFQLITTTNPVMGYDSVALYNSAHSNGPDSNTLSLTSIQTAIVKMRTQTAFSESSEILGERNKPKIFLVPTQLELVAQRLLNPSDAYLAAIANPSTEQSLDPQAYKGMGMTYVVLDFLTSTTGWYAVADPAEVATFVIGFLNGKEDPELFVQDQPNVGSNFTADKVTYKVRHIYGGVVEDHRSFYQGDS